MDKKKVFVSIPMRGRSQEGIQRERKIILDNIPSLTGIDGVLEIPMLSELEAKSNHPAHCLGSSIQDMSNADLVVFAPGWRDARGCAIEHAVCMLYMIPYVELANDGNGYFVTRKESWDAQLQEG